MMVMSQWRKQTQRGDATCPGSSNKEALETLAGLTGSVGGLAAQGLLAETTLSLYPAAPPTAIGRGSHHMWHLAEERSRATRILSLRNRIEKG